MLQAMVHELIGIQDNKVDLRNMGKLPKDQQVGPVVVSKEFLIVTKAMTLMQLLFPLIGGCSLIRTRFIFQSEHV